MPQPKDIFLDRDGTVSVEMGYIHEADLPRYALNLGAAEGMKRLQRAGYKLVLVTNQSGVARGYYPEHTVGMVHERLKELLRAEGVSLDAIYYCPHHAKPEGLPDTGDAGTAGRTESVPVEHLSIDCDCRKPKDGMGRRALKDLGLDLKGSWMIGDKAADLGFAQNLGVEEILVLTGYGQGTLEKLVSRGHPPRHVARNLNEAAEIILKAL